MYRLKPSFGIHEKSRNHIPLAQGHEKKKRKHKSKRIKDKVRNNKIEIIGFMWFGLWPNFTE
jgi:hypothetical protein